MLKSLFIKNFILIDEARIDFLNGFNVICGETGAGKSVIIKALDVVLGAKANRDMALDKTLPIVIEAEFTDTVISREIHSNSKFRLNGLLSSLDEIKELRESLIDIHTQHQTYYYMSAKHHIGLLDSFCAIKAPEFKELLKTYKETFLEFKQVEKKLTNLKENLSDNEREIDFLTFQLKELDDAAVRDDEEDEIKEELNILSNAADLKEGSYAAYWALYGDNQSLIEALSKIKYEVSNLAELDKNLKEQEELIFDAIENLKDCANTLSSYSSSLEVNPMRLEELNERISLIQKLKRKYGANLSQERDKIASKLDELTSGDNDITALEENYNTLLASINLMAQKIEDYRKNYSDELKSLVEDKLKSLELPEAKFDISIKEGVKNELGQNNIEFLIATNKFQDLMPLAKVASGGEISRVMLALKTIFTTNDNVLTAVFDEIDTGISGVASVAVANSICDLAKTAQVISITHQPIIAAKADNFIWINKSHNEKTNIKVEILDKSKRLDALAQLAGGEVNEKSLEFAKTLI